MIYRTCTILLLSSLGHGQEIQESCVLSEVSYDITPGGEVPQAEEKPCLLAHRVSFRKAASFAAQRDAHRAWRERQVQLELEVNESQSILDQFIEEQAASGDACSARLMESKRTLDGLLHDLKEVSLEVSSHEQILETETENLNITHMSIEAVKTETAEALKKCQKERAEAVKEVAQYSAELQELIQIAEPGVRYQHSVKTLKGSEKKDISKLEKLSLSSIGETLVQKSEWTHDRCLAFVDFAKRHDYNLQTHMPKKQAPTKRACDEQREDLQKAFTKAFLEVKDLLKDARERVEDDSCFESAHAKKAAEMVPLVAARDQSAGRIEYSASGLAATEPVLHLVTDRAEQLRAHIKDTLTPECKEAGEVTEMLQKVRELIISLSECPGRDDFRLKIPKDEKEEEEEKVDKEDPFKALELSKDKEKIFDETSLEGFEDS